MVDFEIKARVPQSFFAETGARLEDLRIQNKKEGGGIILCRRPLAKLNTDWSEITPVI